MGEVRGELSAFENDKTNGNTESDATDKNEQTWKNQNIKSNYSHCFWQRWGNNKQIYYDIFKFIH